MNCEEVDKHLTEYLDESLDLAMTTRVATHVISCAHCRAGSNELADCIQQVASLPAMSPPLGFAQRVMAHVRDSEPKPSLWQRLLAPLISRVPVQAAAMAVIAVFAVVLYQKAPALKPNNEDDPALNFSAQMASKETPLSAPTALSPARQASETGGKSVTPGKAPADVAKLNAGEKSPRALSADPAPPQTLQTASAGPSNAIESAGEESRDLAPRRPPLRVQEVNMARDSGLMFGDQYGFTYPIPSSFGVMRQTPARTVPLVMEQPIALGDRVADFEFIVRRRSPQRRDTIENLSSSKASPESTEPDGSPANPPHPATPSNGRARIESIAEIRFYNVAPEHFDIFKKELAAEANIESEPRITAREVEAAKQGDRQLLVKVTILPSDRSQTSR